MKELIQEKNRINAIFAKNVIVIVATCEPMKEHTQEKKL